MIRFFTTAICFLIALNGLTAQSASVVALAPITPLVFAQPDAQRDLDYTQEICFDKKFYFTVSNHRSRPGLSIPALAACVYLNTQKGYAGFSISADRELPVNCIELNAGNENFDLAVYALKGQMYSFSAEFDRTGHVEYLMHTGMSDLNPALGQIRSIQAKSATKTNLTRRFFGEITATAYRVGGYQIFLYGRTYPATLTFQNVLGFLGAGYVQTNRGGYVMLAAQKVSGYPPFVSVTTSIASLSGASNCFPPSFFTDADLQDHLEGQEANTQRITELMVDEAEIQNSTGPCKEIEQRIISLKLDLVHKEDALNQQTINENLSKPSADYLRKSGEVLISVQKVDELIAEQELEICGMQNSEQPISCQSQKMQCRQEHISALRVIRLEVQTVERNFVNKPLEIIERKGQLVRKLNAISACNYDRNCRPIAPNLSEMDEKLRGIIRN